jgi:predicted secreted hydrolase
VRRRTHIPLRALATIAVALSICAGCGGADKPRQPQTQSLHAMLMSDGTVGFAQATEPASMEFPRDHGPHRRFRIEWWYFTGSLATPAGREFGYQLTFFRRALAPSPDRRPSAWSTNQMYMAHFALTDMDDGAHEGHERLARGAAGLAGADAEPFRVWVDDWRAESTGSDMFPMRLVARAGDVAVDLTLTDAKPIVQHGRDGFSVKTRDGGAASYYYSFTRVNTEGAVVVGGRRHAVAGASWIDREWSTSVLDTRHTGWDWFSLQFDDRTELMCFRMRHADGPESSHTAGTFIDEAGSAFPLAPGDVEIEETDSWTSATNGGTYPSEWRIRIPSQRLDATVVAAVADQEMALSFVYWEGAVRAVGSRRGKSITGRGYVEMTGYAGGRAAGQP